MSDHLVVFVDCLARPVPVDPVAQTTQVPFEPSPPPAVVDADAAGSSDTSPSEDCDDEGDDEEEQLIQMAECHICQEEDGVSNLETPCACSGSLKYAHRKCVQHWCDEKGDITCEICHHVCFLHNSFHIPVLFGYCKSLGCPGIARVYLDGDWEGSGSPKWLFVFFPSILTLPHLMIIVLPLGIGTDCRPIRVLD
ncbi:hypothetical protein GYH30_009898 [Glycine max]|uniref:RING-CH-type domain-containing protein n=1 Tax=Glycine max TaxID=3847 RepID=A0A0R0K884_SOYBN|nr:hypothetical protein GYH30_009898 [Glycine max]